jgi:hypothetical protein
MTVDWKGRPRTAHRKKRHHVTKLYTGRRTWKDCLHAWKRREMHTECWSGNLKSRDLLEDLDVDVKITLEWILEK